MYNNNTSMFSLMTICLEKNIITIPHTNSNIYSVVRVRVRVTWPEGPWQWLTSPEATLTENDCVRMYNRFPRFFLTILIAQNVPLRMTDMATGCDLTPKGFPCKSARMHNQKLRNIRPSGDFWPEMTSRHQNVKSQMTEMVHLKISIYKMCIQFIFLHF
jgi:hypothetical protein